jgi:hypothetical protein
MKSFLLILGAIVGLIFVIADDDQAETVERNQGPPVAPRLERTTPSLSERNAQRDTHRRTQLASTLMHSSTCRCGKH